ncbi:MAG: diguanylate cyclase [Gammaproteobacteria bacterium]|nr:diguanylate cyclase [Gammaproteobacteria bacterium]
MANTSQSKRRIIAAFGLVISVLIFGVLVNIYTLSNVARHLGRVVDTHNVQIRIMHQILDLARQRSLALQHMLVAEDPFMVDDQIIKMSDIALNYLQLRQQMIELPMTDAERKLLETQYAQTAVTGRVQSQVIGLLSDGNYKEAKILFYAEAIPSQDKAMRLMHKYVALQDNQNRKELEQTKGKIEIQRNRMLLLLAFGLVLSLFIAYWVTQRIQHEIDRRNRIEEDLETRVEERTQQLEQLSKEDSVTKLPNRAAFNQELSMALQLALDTGGQTGLFFMDLDGFKLINDTHGHCYGDKALVEIARRLNKATEGWGLLSRVGGDEFTLVIRDVMDNSKVEGVAEKIIRTINEPLLIDGEDCYVGISIGCVITNGQDISADELITQADHAMYAAKRAGKNRLVLA